MQRDRDTVLTETRTGNIEYLVVQYPQASTVEGRDPAIARVLVTN